MNYICPNCVLRFLGLKKKVKTDYNQNHEMEEQQLINQSVSRHAKSIPAQYFIQNQIEKYQTEDNVQTRLDVELNFKKQSKKTNTNLLSYEEYESSLPQIEEKQNVIDDEQQNQQEQINLQPNFDKFVINLQPYDKHYNLLSQKVSSQKLRKYFSSKGELMDFGTSSNKAKLSVSKIQSNKFLLQYQLPCTYSFYSTLMKDSTITPSKKKLFNLIVQSKMLESFKPNLTMHRLRLQRFNVIERREFVYMKYINGNSGQNWQVCISQSQQGNLSFFENKQGEQSGQYSTMPSQELFKRCQLFSVINLKQHNENLYIKQYLQIDLKAPNMNQNIWNKVINQAKKYFENLFQYVQKNYQQELIV